MARGKRVIDMVGQKFGKLTVTEFAGQDKWDTAHWKCQCECGNTKKVSGRSLRTGRTQSCGCITKERATEFGKDSATHGMAGTRTYRIWSNMKSRCNTPSATSYKWYGERGITYCERWEQFENFLADMGKCPRGMTLDRINVDGNYEPGNCRWASTAEQVVNRRNTVMIEGHALRDLAERFGVNYYTMYSMYKRTPERAIEFVRSKLKEEP